MTEHPVVYVCTQCWKSAMVPCFCSCVPGRIVGLTRTDIMSHYPGAPDPFGRPMRPKPAHILARLFPLVTS